MTEPAPRKSSALKNACVTRWNIARAGCTHAGGEEHEPELADRRVGEHAFDVVLGHREDRGVERRRHTDDGDDGAGDRRELEQRIEADDEVDARRDHRRRVDEGRNRALGPPSRPGATRRAEAARTFRPLPRTAAARLRLPFRMRDRAFGRRTLDLGDLEATRRRQTRRRCR